MSSDKEEIESKQQKDENVIISASWKGREDKEVLLSDSERRLKIENQLLIGLIKESRELFTTRMQQVKEFYNKKYKKEYEDKLKETEDSYRRKESIDDRASKVHVNNERFPERENYIQPSDAIVVDEDTSDHISQKEPKEKEYNSSSTNNKELEERVKMLEEENGNLKDRIKQLEQDLSNNRSVQSTMEYSGSFYTTKAPPGSYSPYESGNMSPKSFNPEGMSLKELKQYILSKGLRCDDCFEREDLVARAKEASMVVGFGSTRSFISPLNPSESSDRGSGLGNIMKMQQLRSTSQLSPKVSTTFEYQDHTGSASSLTSDIHNKISLDHTSESANAAGTASGGIEYQEIVPQYTAPQQGIYFEGWLKKSPPTGSLKKWRKRWFILTNRNIVYFKSPTSLMAIGVIELLRILVKPDTREEALKMDEDKRTSFVIQTPHRDYVLIAETVEECKKWMETIRTCADALNAQYYFERQKQAGPSYSYRVKLAANGTMFIPGELEANWDEITASVENTSKSSSASSLSPSKEASSKALIQKSKKSCYDWLGVLDTATIDEIQTAFETKSKECNPKLHPEKNQLEYHMVKYSWNILGNALLKMRYDMSQKTLSLFRAGFVCHELILNGTFALWIAMRDETEQIKRFNREWDEYGTRPKKSLGGAWTRNDIEQKMKYYSDYGLDRIFWQPALGWDIPNGYFLADSIETNHISQVATYDEAKRNGFCPANLEKVPEDKLSRIIIIQTSVPLPSDRPISSSSSSSSSTNCGMFILEMETEIGSAEIALGLRVLLEEKYNKSMQLEDE